MVRAVVCAARAVALLGFSACNGTVSLPEETAEAAGADVRAEPESSRTTAGADAAAFDGSMDGRYLYEQACASCHEHGFNGAPRLVAGDWPYRDVLGVDAYTRIAIAGIGIMPPRGGQTNMTDEQVRAAVEYMLSELQ